MLIPLETFLEMTSEETVKEVISTFYCSKDHDIESFLKNENKAILYERKFKSRTYLIFDEDGLENGSFVLLAYFTIAIQTLKIPNGTAVSQIRKLDGLYAKKGSEALTEIPSYLIGQLSKNDKHADKIAGDELLQYALSVINKAQGIVGGRVAFIECQDRPQLISFYTRNGFKYFRKDPDDGLVQMVRLLDK
ncbi:hypothetical protein [Pelotomaculum sp. PtaB.Bin117]|uniref:hypothetical protein n=1 Tax=Pelotomaculum sp. PtaB.Bin117 TaxID=1811694 RepID=UPI0009C8A0F2|nr:hypothetical protein [Pelotomaculum sp. PtaB.Bin117]OPX87176.1 MAG: hypothetical protein A4E54_01775 [Pelotomaculum sp. PtaB.Bin117]OPY60884.1 MAG: hypothetical protein A4E56_02421 [Pelotomaculum sp. PtaU1.Bin065]